MNRTTSEAALFEHFCARSGVACTSISAAASPTGQRSPDYELAIGDLTLIAEVKQIDPNPEEMQKWRKHQVDRTTMVFNDDPRSRIRDKLSDANAALRVRCGNRPGLVVLYNNVFFRPSLISPIDIMAAMYGKMGVTFLPSEDPGIPPELQARLLGDRGVGPSSNTSISAVCVLRGDPADPTLDVFRNHYAAVPLETGHLRLPGIQHFEARRTADDRFPDWFEI